MHHSKLLWGAEKLGLTLCQTQVDTLLAYLQCLLRWNQVYNLTAIKTCEAMITYHVLDSLALAPWIHGTDFLDLGTGAGVPGIPLAIVYPQKKWVLLDSNGKKIRFLYQVKAQLGLTNVAIVHARMDAYHTQTRFHAITARALGHLYDVINAARSCCHEQGRFLLMKGRYPKEELGVLHRQDITYRVHKLSVPGLEAQRHLVEVLSEKNQLGARAVAPTVSF